MRKRFFSRRLAVTTAATLGALIVGVAFANWTATGSGSASAKAVTAQVSAVTTDAAGAADLYPGFTGGDLYFEITNPNPYPVSFDRYTLGAITMSDGGGTPCGTATGNISVPSGEQTLTGAAKIDVPANTTVAVSDSIANVVSMSATAATECQGDSFTIAITLTGTQT